jgi:hypothetical protein
MLEQTITLDDGTKIEVKVHKSDCGGGFIVCHQIFQVGLDPSAVSCNGSCTINGELKTFSWECPDGYRCSLSCVSDGYKTECIPR